MLDERQITKRFLAPYLRNTDVQWDGINVDDLPEMDFDESEQKLYGLRPGDILMCEGGEIGRCAIWDSDRRCFYQKALHRLRPTTDKDDPRYFVLVMRAAVEAGLFSSRASAATIQHLPAEKLRVVRYPAPPIEEQRAIVDRVSRQTARLYSLVAAKQRLLDLLAEKRKAIIATAITRGLDPKVKLRDSGVPWLGEIPAHWKAMRVRHLGTLKGGAGFPHEHQGREDEEIPFFKVKDLGDTEASMHSTDNYVSRETAAALRAYVFPARTIVFAKVGAALFLNRFRLLGVSGCIDNNMMGLFLDEERMSVEFALSSLSLIDFKLVANPGAVPSVNEGQVSEFRLAVPPLDEQRAIVEHIVRETTKLDAVRAATERTIALLKERRSALIAAAVTGQLDVGAAA